MKKRLQKPLLIDNVYFFGKGEVACSNHASSTTLFTIFPFIFRALWKIFFHLVVCIFAVLISIYIIGYALGLQEMNNFDTNPTQNLYQQIEVSHYEQRR